MSRYSPLAITKARNPQPSATTAMALPTADLDRYPQPIISPMGRPIWNMASIALGNPFFRVPQLQNLHLMEQLVETIPLINGALSQIVRLVGTPTIEADEETQAELTDWMDNLSVNRIQTGFANWLPSFLIDNLTYGRAHAEIILPVNMKDIFAVQSLHPRTVELRPRYTAPNADPNNAGGYYTPGTTGMNASYYDSNNQGGYYYGAGAGVPATNSPGQSIYGLDIVQYQTFAGTPVLLNPRLMLTAVHDLRVDDPQGKSALFGLPFVAEIYTKLFTSLRHTWERFGTPTYHVQYKPPTGQGGLSDPTGAKSTQYVSSMVAGLRNVVASRMQGDIKDIGTSGEVEIKVLGAEGETLDISVPSRVIAEQIIAKFGIPPMLLGLSWSSTERMSAVQASLLSEMIDELRLRIEPELRYLFRLRQLLTGGSQEFDIAWDAPTLLDEMETARAKLFDAQGETAALENDQTLWRLGVINAPEFVRRHRKEYANMDDEEILALPELADLATEPPELMPPTAPGGKPASNTGDSLAGTGSGGGMMAYAGNGNGRAH